MAEVFILEDDKMLGRGISLALDKDGYEVTFAHNYVEGINMCSKKIFDIYLLDINLPDGDGRTFCGELRKYTDNPVIFITANDTENDIIQGYDTGCDDYISKPFSLKVLRKKIEIIMKKSKSAVEQNNGSCIQAGNLTIDMDKMTVLKDGGPCRLTATEYKLLEYLAVNKGKVVTRNAILENLWDIDGSYIDENTLSVNIGRLRKKLENDPKNPAHIITVFGIGYTFEG